MPHPRTGLILLLLAALAVGAGCTREGGSGAKGPPAPVGPPVTTPSGVTYSDLKIGDGPRARAGLTVAVHYSGWLADGTLFDTSLKHVRPFVFRLGEGEVIQGWDEGLMGMRVGGKRLLVVPPELAYGDKGVPGMIPPGATLTFQVELMGVN